MLLPVTWHLLPDNSETLFVKNVPSDQEMSQYLSTACLPFTDQFGNTNPTNCLPKTSIGNPLVEMVWPDHWLQPLVPVLNRSGMQHVLRAQPVPSPHTINSHLKKNPFDSQIRTRLPEAISRAKKWAVQAWVCGLGGTDSPQTLWNPYVCLPFQIKMAMDAKLRPLMSVTKSPRVVILPGYSYLHGNRVAVWHCPHQCSHQRYKQMRVEQQEKSPWCGVQVKTLQFCLITKMLVCLPRSPHPGDLPSAPVKRSMLSQSSNGEHHC